MDAAIRQRVRLWAADRCEYCKLPQRAVEATFHVEHVVARQHHGSDEEENLALACNRCNLHKGPNLSALDPESGQLVALFHPRQNDWNGHFELRGSEIVGKTAIGRTTVRLLQMNSRNRRELRAVLSASGQL